MSPGELAAEVRRGAGLFRLRERGLLAVVGADRARWLDGMISNDVRSLGPERTGCAALALTRTGRVVADLHVLWRPEELWLELDARALGPARAHLEKFIIADDVELAERSAAHARLALEGPALPGLLRALGAPQPSADGWVEAEIEGTPVLLAGYGWSGEPAVQLFVAPEAGDALAAAIARAAQPGDALVEAGPEVLEILRIEAGIPRYGAELDESVLPDEAGLGAAVSTSKGCYTGQEVVARLRSQGRLSHLLVGISTEGTSPLQVGAEVQAGGKRVGEVTSACLSPAAGAIALAFLRRPHQEPGTRVSVAGRPARVVPLPFAGPQPGPG